MGATSEQLFLQVDASVELLRREMMSGDAVMDRFAQKAETTAAKVESAIGGMGRNFGAFATLAEDAATRAQKSFEASFSQIQRMAATAIAGPTVGGDANLGIEDLRAGAAAARQRAAAYAELTAAAERVAAAENDTTQATRLFIQAGTANRIEAERQAAALESEAGALERIQIELRGSASATELFVSSHQRVAEAAAEERRLAQAATDAATAQRANAAAAALLRDQIDPMYAAQQRFDAELTRAETLLADGVITLREYEQAHAVAAGNLQAHAAAVTGLAGAQDRQAKAAADAAAAERTTAAAVAQLRGELDPMFAAQQRFDVELTRAEALLATGAITTREYDQAVQHARDTLNAHAVAAAGDSDAQKRRKVELDRNTQAIGLQRQAMQQLSYQANDVATQFASGTPPMQIFAQQSGQVFQALGLMAQGAAAAGKGVEATGASSDDAGVDVEGLGDKVTGVAEKATEMKGKFGAVAGFLAGPWGAVMIAALAVLTPFVLKMFENNDALGDAVEKLKAEAEQTDLNRRAKEAFTRTIYGEIEAQRQLNDEVERSIRTQRQQQQYTAFRATEQLTTNRASRPGLVQDIAQQQREVDEYQRRLDAFKNDPNSFGASASRSRLEAATARLADLQKQLVGLDAAIVSGERTARSAQQALMQSDVEASFDRKAAAALRYTKQLALLNVQQSIGAGKTGTTNEMQADGSFKKVTVRGIDNDTYRREIRRIRLERDSVRDSDTWNRQYGRSVSSGEAASIVRSIGGQVNSGDRTYQDQKRLYDAWVAQGRPADNPVAKPGTSAHERSNALDVQKTPGMTIAKLKEAFAAEGVRLTKAFGERGHFHIEWAKPGRSGPSAETTARRTEAARVAVLKDDTAFTDQEREARHKLLDATRRTAASEVERDALLREDIDAEADAAKRKIANQLSAGDIDGAQAKQLETINEATRKQRLQNVQIERASATIRDQVEARAQSIDEQLAGLQIESDLARTSRSRRAVELRILALQEERERILQQAVIDDPKSSQQDRDRAAGAIRAVDVQHAGRVEKIERDTRGPWDSYLDDMKAATADTDAAFEQVAVNGLGKFNDQLTGAVSKIFRIGGAFGQVADQIISDLIRIAIQEATTAIFGGGSGGGGSAAASGGGTADASGSTGFLSSLKGLKFFAAGGDPPVGQASVVGERGPELFVPTVAGRILPNGRSLSMPRLPSPGALQPRSASVAISMPVRIDAAGADPAALARVERSLNDHLSSFGNRVIGVVNDGLQRGMVGA